METLIPTIIISTIIVGIIVLAFQKRKKTPPYEFKPPAEPPKLEDEEGDYR